MHVFVTGLSGWVGTALTPLLLERGHEVTALVRSDESRRKLEAAGVRHFIRGSTDDHDVLKQGAAAADAVIHLAFTHDFAAYDDSVVKDLAAHKAIASVLEGTNKIFITTNGTAVATPGVLATEDRGTDGLNPALTRGNTDTYDRSLAQKGIRSAVIRLAPTVHGAGDHGLIPFIISKAKENGFIGYAGNGSNRWPAGHVRDSAMTYVLALEKVEPGSVYHATAEEGVAWKDIAEAVSKKHNIPAISQTSEQMIESLGFIGGLASIDNPTSSKLTRERLGWEPKEIGLLEDIAANY